MGREPHAVVIKFMNLPLCHFPISCFELWFLLAENSYRIY